MVLNVHRNHKAYKGRGERLIEVVGWLVDFPALRWAAIRAILMFSVGGDGQSRKTVFTNHNLFEEKGEPKPASNRGHSAYQPNAALPLGQTGLQACLY